VEEEVVQVGRDARSTIRRCGHIANNALQSPGAPAVEEFKKAVAETEKLRHG
jgi:hypothetical protein